MALAMGGVPASGAEPFGFRAVQSRGNDVDGSEQIGSRAGGAARGLPPGPAVTVFFFAVADLR